jgi:hypothetical protein
MLLFYVKFWPDLKMIDFLKRKMYTYSHGGIDKNEKHLCPASPRVSRHRR